MPFADDKAGKKYRRQYYLRNREEIRAKASAYYKKNKALCDERVKRYEQRLGKVVILEYRRLHNKTYNTRLRDEVIAAYGGKCACCGEAEREFLCLDHIGNWGGKHRKAEGWKAKGKALFLRLKNQGFPKDKWRLLCMNCNQATRYGDECPHQRVNVTNVLSGMAC